MEKKNDWSPYDIFWSSTGRAWFVLLLGYLVLIVVAGLMAGSFLNVLLLSSWLALILLIVLSRTRRTRKDR